MADFKFTCAHCGQEIELDELWTGHQIQCPTCQKELTVPAKPDAPPHATLAAAKPGQPKLSIGQGQAARSTVPKGLAPQAAALEQKLAQAKANQKSSATKWIVPIVVILVLGVGGYLAYPYVQDFIAKRSKAAKDASTNATDQASAATNAEPAQAPAPEKELPVIPPIWTLDVDKAVIPAAKANGMIAGTNFVVETARLDKVGPAYLLRLVEGGTLIAPDRGFMLYLYLGPGETITNHTWTVSQDKKTGVPQVVKLVKTNPRYAPKQTVIRSGYALKLELGDIANGVISGKIFLAVPPQAEQSVVAGAFKAATSVGDPNAATAVTPVAAPTPAPAVANPAAAERTAAFKQRYGVKR